MPFNSGAGHPVLAVLDRSVAKNWIPAFAGMTDETWNGERGVSLRAAPSAPSKSALIFTGSL
jgi:hypothetical protein